VPCHLSASGQASQNSHPGIQVIKDIASATIQGGEPVWFGCDVGTMMSNDYALWDAGLSWFGQYVFEIAARKSALPAGLQSALAAEPIVLPAWDPMGALAR
jgi:aminopeptidase C